MRVIRITQKHLKTPEERRKAKGYALFSKGYVAVMDIKATKFKVLSENEPATEDGKKLAYTVELAEIPSCTCPDFIYNTTECKHIYAARYARREAGYIC